MGSIEILVGGLSLTAHDVAGEGRADVEWYLGPLLHWLADNWVPLLHEELLPWARAPSGPAASSAERSLAFWSQHTDKDAENNYRTVQAWYRRHCLASAATGGLLPTVYIRRLSGAIEVSWTGRAPEFAPDGFRFGSALGTAQLSISDVAEPLWSFLRWAVDNPPKLKNDHFIADWEDLCRKVDILDHKPANEFAADIAHQLLERVRNSFVEAGRSELVEFHRSPNGPYIEAKPLAVAMYGGLHPGLTDGDIVRLRNVLIARANLGDSELLEEFSESDMYKTMGLKPYDDGYHFSDAFLDELQDKNIYEISRGFVDIHRICAELSIDVQTESFDTTNIRGVALAGQGFGPTILINTNHPFNDSEPGKRFTIAHELCHIIADRDRAQGIGHTSGKWALPSIEQRANAFAAYLLMPRDLVVRRVGALEEIGVENLRTIAAELRVGMVALAHHLCNLDLIDEPARDRLLLSLRTAN